MIYKISPLRVGVTFSDEVVNNKGQRKYLNIRVEDYDGEVYLIPINEIDKHIIGAIQAGFLDFNRWITSEIVPEQAKYLTKCEEDCGCEQKEQHDVAYA